MIHRDNGELIAECECGESHYGGTLEFREFVDELRRDGWRIHKREGEWIHECPECVEGAM